MDLSETDPRSLPRAIDNTEELSYPLPIFQPRPKCPRQSTEHTLVNQVKRVVDLTCPFEA